jgi:hypothetical protein
MIRLQEDFCVPVWYSYTGTYNRLPEDEPSGAKHAEDIVKFKTLV